MKNVILLMVLLSCSTTTFAQDVNIDGRLQPLLNEFIESCKAYNINYHEKLFKLQSIDIVNTLPVSENSSTLGMLRRNDSGEVIAIEINWMAQLDPQILKVVAFHEFAHYFLEYATHVCDDCDHIMAVVNTSYFDIIQDWDNQLRRLFQESPALLKRYGKVVASSQYHCP